LLNQNETAAATESFLERFLYFALTAVNASGGTFVKWTGDGFLAFFETPLDREVGSKAAVIFEAAWWLTAFVNETQMCCPTEGRFRIRHAVTYEKDAVWIDLRHSGDIKSKDVLGRSVVAAFRLSGIECTFPGIVTHGEIVRAIGDANLTTHVTFKELPLTDAMRSRYFKGERFGTKDICVSANKSRRIPYKPVKFEQRNAQITSGRKVPDTDLNLFPFRRDFFVALASRRGPRWFQPVLREFGKKVFVPAITASLSKRQRSTPSFARFVEAWERDSTNIDVLHE
jgi:hypothetical protein